MAPKLKHFFDEAVVRGLARDLAQAHPALAEARFVREGLDGLEALELTARARHLAEVMRRHLPEEFPRAAAILLRALGPKLTGTESFGMAPFRYLPHVFYVEKYGLAHFEEAMELQYELTQRFSAESSIRAYLVRHPEATLRRLERWAQDPSPHVRRLVSEGTRPRLPWAPRLRAFQLDPSPVLALLERLKDDPDRYVQRSVANNLNDIAKDHPARTAEVCRRWSEGASAGRAWIVRHALRTLVKQGHPAALSTLGAGARPKVQLEEPRLRPARLAVGDELRISCTLRSRSSRTQALLVDFAVHYVKADGSTRRKVFKLRALELAPRGQVHLARTLSFVDRSTRKHYPGRHALELLVNGEVFPLGSVRLSR